MFGQQSSLRFLSISDGQALHLNAAACACEFRNLVGIATEQHGHGKSNFDSWKAAVVLTTRSRDRYPTRHLGPLLQAFGAWTCSSSGVEQNFSVDKWLVAKRPLAVQHELDHLQIVISGCDDKKLLKESAAVWTALYGRPRCSTRRLRGYSKKKQSLNVPSLSRVLLARRKAAGKRAAAGHRPVEEVANMAIAAAAECWTEKHEAESQRQNGLKLDRQIDAFEKNQLLEHECTGLEAQSQLRQQRIAVRKRQRENEQTRLAEKMSRPNFNLFGHTCWIQPTCGFNPGRINEILLEHHMRRHQHEQSVDLFVVPDIASPPPEIQVLAAMRGSIVGSPQFFSSGGQVGCCIGFEPAIRQTRKIYISDQFSQSHQSSAAALKWMLRGSDWEMLQSLAAWLRVQVQNPKNSSRAWALLSEGEKQQHQALKDHQYAMTLKSFLSTVSTVDRSRTALGIGLST